MCKVEEREKRTSREGPNEQSEKTEVAKDEGDMAWMILLSTMLDTMCMALIIPVQSVTMLSVGELNAGARERDARSYGTFPASHTHTPPRSLTFVPFLTFPAPIIPRSPLPPFQPQVLAQWIRARCMPLRLCVP